METIKRFLKDEKGLETIEWTLMGALIVLGISAAVIALKGHITGVFDDLGIELDKRPVAEG